ncbi:UvrD-helicase domain-containing protein [Halodesulfovibrio aestuarii]|uniref:DNA 3'-5' helicase n=1 Tax=Halodesulfovibrio aestuarii TaxID=126333 RepID=A0A8G2CC78_9BACT|nr:ATP-dependent helicase [Halodesulfovibrio aestuarii]SHJ73824.1 UvrD-like helicase C-terminal domain-containing protein [Halodesulfovibrio aestuarii]
MIDVAGWKPSGVEQMEPAALSAATSIEGSLLLTAGPGAGKTEVLAQRAGFLLQTGLTRYPKRILAISFKVDATRNIKDRVIARCGYEKSTRFDSFTFHGFALMLIQKFRPVLTGREALDVDFTVGDVRVDRKQITFSDFLPLAISILQQCEYAGRALRATYSDVFLDEFQDCTDRQYELLQLAFKGSSSRVVAVGDYKQRIMGWANALEGVFEQYREDFEANVSRLYMNFRSKKRLRRMQNEIVQVLEPEAVLKMVAEDQEEGTVEIWHFDNCAEEAIQVRKQIQTWIEEGLPVSEIAIIVRSDLKYYLQKVMSELSQHEIPFRDEHENQDLIHQPIFTLIIDYLLILFGDREPEAWSNFWETIKIITLDVDSESFAQEIRDHLNGQCKKVKNSREEFLDFESKWTLVRELLNKLKHQRLALLSYEYQKLPRLQELVKQAKDLIEVDDEMDDSFVMALHAVGDINAVRLLTMHKAKGLEFEAVILQAVEANTFWGDDVDENLCTFFVGASRAKSHLVLTHCSQRERPEGFPVRRPWTQRRTPQNEYLGYARAVIPED